MYDIVVLTRVIPLEIKDYVLTHRKGTMSESGESLQWKIINGIDFNNGSPVKLFNYLPVQSYPDSYTEAFVKKYNFEHTNNAEDVCLPFLNIKIIKRLFMGKSLYAEIRKWAKNTGNRRKVVISYSLTPEFSKAMKIAKKINPSIITCSIVADLPEYTVLTKNIDILTRIYLTWMKKSTNALLKYIDCFALLTEYMAEKLVTHQPYIVMEGISTKDVIVKREERKEKRVFYAGTLNEKFGIMNLVEAFKKIQNSNYRLTICGMGDSEEFIRNEAKLDSRIEFLGLQKREDVLELMGQARVIVNPRCTDEEFTRYSFPSKNLEALSSGVPFIGYKLEGIPDEYDKYMNYPSSKKIDALASKIVEICEDEESIYSMKAAKAKEWVDSYKNEIAQTKRILELIDSMCMKEEKHDNT